MHTIIRFLKNWTLPIAMLAGALGYLVYAHYSCFDVLRPVVGPTVRIVQPLLIFCMLFLTFCRIRFQDLRFTAWIFWTLAFQLCCFTLCVIVLLMMPPSHWSVVMESAMLCLICPTATAAVVVTSKLGGNAATLTTYTTLINLCVAIAVPALLPLAHPMPDVTFFDAFLMIVSKIFPLLFCPFVLAMLLRAIDVRITEWFSRFHDLPFYLWSVGLALAIAVTTKSIVQSDYSLGTMTGIACASAATCILQFAVGRKIGRHFGEPISAAQSCGQKNTIFAIWMGYTFLDPVTSLAGGFYSIWHNMYNSYQLYKQRQK
ncbi:MAG: transporter [Bacteroidaceae bacterium]|nr:transporter [Bacteroidaceae bacterium]